MVQDDKEAAYWYRKAAEQGRVVAQYNLGLMHTIGRGVARDYSEGVTWYRKAAEQGDADAQYALGSLYMGSVGVVRDDKESTKWLRKAARQGHARAQFDLGLLYSRGQGQDYVSAHMWLNLAAANGIGDAVAKRNELAKKMTPEKIAEAQRLAREFNSSSAAE
ncbi:MAG: sel1 repeat family protein [Magnetococcus sp. YQC-3]